MSDHTLSDEMRRRIESLDWYHTMELAPGLVTRGFYDLRPDLSRYRLPDDLYGKTVLDIGAASGFFSFEFERRGAKVTALDLPAWDDHDRGPRFWLHEEEKTRAQDMHEEFELARQALGSKAEKVLMNIYDISPETVGMFDIVFCGSMLLHITDPIRALWRIGSVARERAIIATSVMEVMDEVPCAFFQGHIKGDTWWVPTRSCLELWVANSSFEGLEYVDQYHPMRKGEPTGPLQGIIHAYKSKDGWGTAVRSCESINNRYLPRLVAPPAPEMPRRSLLQRVRRRLGL